MMSSMLPRLEILENRSDRHACTTEDPGAAYLSVAETLGWRSWMLKKNCANCAGSELKLAL
jgi:hypothetical protein